MSLTAAITSASSWSGGVGSWVIFGRVFLKQAFINQLIFVNKNLMKIYFCKTKLSFVKIIYYSALESSMNSMSLCVASAISSSPPLPSTSTASVSRNILASGAGSSPGLFGANFSARLHGGPYNSCSCLNSNISWKKPHLCCLIKGDDGGDESDD